MAGLCALAVAGFVTILTEALPVGLLPQIGDSMGVSEAMAGQWISIYALGSLLAAIPLTAATRSWCRRPLLLGAIIGFAIANLITALTASFICVIATQNYHNSSCQAGRVIEDWYKVCVVRHRKATLF